MRSIPRSYRRLAAMLLSLPLLLLLLALLYQTGMAHLEGKRRTLGQGLEWAAATLTTTGYGPDVTWSHPAMQLFVIVVQFGGVLLLFLVFPIFLIPFFEERFQVRIPTVLPDLAGQVLVYRYGPAVTWLLDELDKAKIPVVIFEEDEQLARRLRERGRKVVLGNLGLEDPDLRNLMGARGMVANGDDDHNAAMTLSARYHGYKGPIVALVTNPSRRPPMVRAGATEAFMPEHVLAAALAARASAKINPRIAGVRNLGRHLEVAELRVRAGSPLAGKTIAESGLRQQTGATIAGLWLGGELIQRPIAGTRLEVGTILVVVGTQPAIERLSQLATPVPKTGPFLVVGYGDVGRKVAEFLREAGEAVSVLDAQEADGVDYAGDPLNHRVLERAGLREAQAVVLTLEGDAATLFGVAVVRNLAPDVMIVAGARRAENVARIHRAGADFALSVSQVAGQLLALQLLGQELVSLEAQIKIVTTAAGPLAGQPLAANKVLQRAGCWVVAVERGDEVIVEFDQHFRVEPGDVVYLCGTTDTIAEYFRDFPETQEHPIARLRAALLNDGKTLPG